MPLHANIGHPRFVLWIICMIYYPVLSALLSFIFSGAINRASTKFQCDIFFFFLFVGIQLNCHNKSHIKNIIKCAAQVIRLESRTAPITFCNLEGKLDRWTIREKIWLGRLQFHHICIVLEATSDSWVIAEWIEESKIGLCIPR